VGASEFGSGPGLANRFDRSSRALLRLARRQGLVGAMLLAVGAALTISANSFSQSPARRIDRVRMRAMTYRERRDRARRIFLRRGLDAGALPHAYRDAVARMRTMQQVRSAASTPMTPAWTFIGPQPMYVLQVGFGGATPPGSPPIPNATGRITAIVADPTSSGRFFVGAANGGVWMTTDGGITFKPIADSLPTQAIGSPALDATTSPNPTL
jgi:hypothetical protein